MTQTKIRCDLIWLILVIAGLVVPVYAAAAEPDSCVAEDKLEKELLKEVEF